jgi:hypothetical protein
VLADALTEGARRVDEAKIDQWPDFQRWLEMDAPYDVAIAFRTAILTAFNKREAAPGEKQIVPLRIRRDVNALIVQGCGRARLSQARRTFLGIWPYSVRIYELGKTSAEVAQLIKTVAKQCVFPSPEDVENEIFADRRS